MKVIRIWLGVVTFILQEKHMGTNAIKYLFKDSAPLALAVSREESEHMKLSY